MSSFEGKRVLVTGGANGLGKSIVQKFLKHKATVFVIDKDNDALANLKKEYEEIHPLTVDLANWTETRKAVESILPLHHLVNNVGVLVAKDFLDTTETDIDFMFQVNYKSHYNVSQCFVKGVLDFKIGSATIVNISSVAQRVALPGLVNYTASKTALSSLTRSMAAELGIHGIRVNSVLPGSMNTKLCEDALNSHQGLRDYTKTMVGRGALKNVELETYDVANVVFFLSSCESAMVTGEEIGVDGGVGFM